MKERLVDFDRLKGLAILLVVVGHLVARQGPNADNIYSDIKLTIYSFHMPVFMFVCGFILAYTRKPIDSISDYAIYIRKKTYRLMPAYLLFAFVIFFGKLIFSQFMHVDNPVDGVSDMYRIFVDPINSYSSYLWFIYTLFIYYLIFPLLYRITKNRIYFLLPVGVILGYLELTKDVTTYFCISRVFEYFFVFTLGCCASDYYKKYDYMLDKLNIVFIIAFIVALIFIPKVEGSRYVIGLFAIPALHVFCRMEIFAGENLLAVLGDYTFPIYLMNTIFIGVAKGVILYFTEWTIISFLIMVPFLLVAGVYGPIFTQKYILSRTPLINQWVR